MAVGKRRPRSLTVNGRRFRWRCEFHDPAERYSVAMAEGRITSPDRLVIRPESCPHRLLTVSWPPCHGPVVLPGLVRACVEAASRRGWPDERASLELAGKDVPARS